MFDTNSKTATILYAAGSGQKIIQFTAGSAVMVVDGTAITMENGAVAEIKDDRMYVPFRALGTALGVSVSWDEETRTAIYNA
jgi:archaellum component FlaG (FlaF/FlaG flagellin family)